MSTCGSCELYGKEHRGLVCPGNLDKAECAETLQRLVCVQERRLEELEGAVHPDSVHYQGKPGGPFSTFFVVRTDGDRQSVVLCSEHDQTLWGKTTGDLPLQRPSYIEAMRECNAMARTGRGGYYRTATLTHPAAATWLQTHFEQYTATDTGAIVPRTTPTLKVYVLTGRCGIACTGVEVDTDKDRLWKEMSQAYKAALEDHADDPLVQHSSIGLEEAEVVTGGDHYQWFLIEHEVAVNG